MASKNNKPSGKKGRPTAGGKASRPAPKAQAVAKSGGGVLSWWETAVQFLREVKTELKKVTWPSRKQTISSTSVVLVLVILISVFLGVVDYILAGFVRWVIS